MIKRFHASHTSDNYERLAGLKQGNGPVSEFRERFEMLSATLEDVSEVTLRGMFLNRLQEEVKADVRVLKPSLLRDLMDVAMEIEGRNLTLEKARQRRDVRGNKRERVRWAISPPQYTRIPPLLEGPKSPNTAIPNRGSQTKEREGLKGSGVSTQASNSSPGRGNRRARGIKRLLEAEINRRRELGLCFKCEEKFRPNHKCKAQRFQLLLVRMMKGRKLGKKISLSLRKVKRMQPTQVWNNRKRPCMG